MCSGARLPTQACTRGFCAKTTSSCRIATYVYIILYNIPIGRYLSAIKERKKIKYNINKEENIDSPFQHYATAQHLPRVFRVNNDACRRCSLRWLYYFYYYYTNICRDEPAVSISFQCVLYYYITRRWYKKTRVGADLRFPRITKYYYVSYCRATPRRKTHRLLHRLAATELYYIYIIYTYKS